MPYETMASLPVGLFPMYIELSSIDFTPGPNYGPDQSCTADSLHTPSSSISPRTCYYETIIPAGYCRLPTDSPENGPGQPGSRGGVNSGYGTLHTIAPPSS